MKCPRNRFTHLDYSKELLAQQQEICKGCSEYKGEQFSWGEHCGASIACLITGKQLGPEEIERLPKEMRESTTHTISDEGRKEWIRRIETTKKKLNRPLW